MQHRPSPAMPSGQPEKMAIWKQAKLIKLLLTEEQVASLKKMHWLEILPSDRFTTCNSSVWILKMTAHINSIEQIDIRWQWYTHCRGNCYSSWKPRGLDTPCPRTEHLSFYSSFSHFSLHLLVTVMTSGANLFFVKLHLIMGNSQHWVFPPQDEEQELHSLQASTWQSTEHEEWGTWFNLLVI